ncbi:MAG: sulfatase [Promethearchaeota archaeon]
MSNLPNVILIITHDTGDYFGCYKYDIESPNIDKLAANGVLFTNHFCSAPQCSPSRGSILTGKMPHSNGLMGLVNRGWFLPESNQTIPKLLKKIGYSTHLIGLQHEHDDPKALGYQNISDRETFPLSDDVIPSAIEFLRDAEEGKISQPFFCSIGFFDTHRPYIYPETVEKPPIDSITVPRYLPDTPEVRKDIADFQAAIKHVDRNIGKILDYLESCSFASNTIIIYTVDHGWAMPKAKCTLYDSGIKTALIMYWPGKIEGGRSYPQLLSNIDLLPTILDFVGMNIPKEIEGKSFYSLLFDGKYKERESIFAELTYHDCYNPMRAIRTKKWKYIKNFETLPTRFEIPIGFISTETTDVFIREHPEYNTPRIEEEFYDLENDPNELVNLTGNSSYSEIMKKLKEDLMNWLRKTQDPILSGKVDAPEDSMDKNT